MHVCFKLQLKLLGLDLSFKLFATASSSLLPSFQTPYNLTCYCNLLSQYLDFFTLIDVPKYPYNLGQLNHNHQVDNETSGFFYHLELPTKLATLEIKPGISLFNLFSMLNVSIVMIIYAYMFIILTSQINNLETCLSKCNPTIWIETLKTS